jgi:hypothetical protein
VAWNPVLTAVVPFHNFEINLNHLKSLLGSITNPLVRVLVICDGVSIGNYESLKAEYSEVKNISFELVDFHSAALTRNHALSKVETEWIAFWDCDDEVYEDRYLELISKDESRAQDLLVGQIELFDDESLQSLGVSKTSTLGSVAKFPAFTRMIYRTQFVQGLLFPPIPLCEDQCFLASLLVRKPRIGFFDTLIYRYRVNNPNQGSSRLFRVGAHIEAIKFLEEIIGSCSEKVTYRALVILKFRLCLSIVKRIQQASLHQICYVALTLIFISFRNPQVFFSIDTLRSPLKKKLLPTLFLFGGLGNQLFQYTFMVARFGLNRFQINVSLGYPRLIEEKLPDLFSFSIEEANVHSQAFVVMKRSLFRFFLKVSSHGSTSFKAKIIFRLLDFVNLLYSRLHEGWGLLLLADGIGYFNDAKPLPNYRFVIGCFHSYIWNEKLLPSQKQRIAHLRETPEWLQSFQSRFNPEQCGVVHIRRGDYVKIPNLGYLTLDYFQEEMRCFLSKGIVSEFLLFSDDPDYVRKMLAEDLIPMSTVFESNQDDAAAILVAMSFGRFFILSNSTYSWWAANLTQHDSPLVVAPKFWYADGRSPSAIYPDDWKLKEVH